MGDHDRDHLRDLSDAQRRAAADQSTSDLDQTGADSDQTASDADQDTSDRDQELSDQDQRASDRDQEAADRDLHEHEGNEDRERAHAASRSDRQTGRVERQGGTLKRAQVAEQRANLAQTRDDQAVRRDVTAHARDDAANLRDAVMAEREREISNGGSDPLGVALKHASEVRARASTDRARAADDRAQAARDRAEAADDRQHAIEELRRSHLDELTGAYRRGFGEDLIRNEIDRARRDDGKLVLAFVDVNALRDLNNSEGHPAGDALLQDVVGSIRARMRSYEPIVRFGGDEFVCTISSIDRNGAQERFGEIAGSLKSGTISVGLAQLRPDDTLETLIERADAELIANRD